MCYRIFKLSHLQAHHTRYQDTLLVTVPVAFYEAASLNIVGALCAMLNAVTNKLPYSSL